MQHPQDTPPPRERKPAENATLSKHKPAKTSNTPRNFAEVHGATSQANVHAEKPNAPMPFLEALHARLHNDHTSPDSGDGRVPSICVLPDPEAVVGRLIREITALLSTGVSPSDIAVICCSQANSRLVSRRLISNRIAAIPVTHAAYARDLRRVLWMTYFSSQLQSGNVHPQDQSNRRLLEAALGPMRWAAVEKELAAIRTRSLESRYCACAEAYLRAVGGVRAKQNRLLRSYLITWEPICRGLSSPTQLLKLSKASAEIHCLTPQAAAGASWRYVFVAGMTDGVWKPRKRQNHEAQFDLVTKVFAASSEELVILTLQPTRSCVLSAILNIAPSSMVDADGSLWFNEQRIAR
jgi:superfamily I DNA/RNA helicase